jgi:macrodomain Ter protein organizer (MatP/YcbG family)
MKKLSARCCHRVDREFQAWERLRRKLQEREAAWAAMVPLTADRERLAAMRSEMARLQQALDQIFGRAMAALEGAGAFDATHGTQLQ